MPKPEYLKPPLSLDDQIALLVARGFEIADVNHAKACLLNFSYYRLSGYWYVLLSDKQNHIFKVGATFERALEIYNFDSELRSIVFNAIEHIEVAMRTRLSYYYSTIHNYPNWYENPILFRNRTAHAKFLDELDKEVQKSKDDFILHHRKTYISTKRLPTWKALEVVSFGKISKLISELEPTDSAYQNLINDTNTFNSDYLTSWINVFAVTRNICAHHGRIWNRRFTIKPKLFRLGTENWLLDSPSNDKLYAIASCLLYMNKSLGLDNNLAQQITDLINQNPFIDTGAMGFTPNWRTEPLWTV